MLRKLKGGRASKVTPTELESVERELAELEHIRWCRFHYLNHWKYGKTKNKKKHIIVWWTLSILAKKIK